MFSIAPVTTPGGPLFDGGEIWVWDFGTPAAFLEHGGHTWDTPHSAAGHFNLALNAKNENINALESVPEPSTFALAALGMLGLAGFTSHRRANR